MSAACVALAEGWREKSGVKGDRSFFQGLTLVHHSAQRKHYLWYTLDISSKLDTNRLTDQDY
jgi:hypothetical protein